MKVQTLMDVLKMAFSIFCCTGVFTSISITLMAVYFGFNYLGELNFGSYSTPVTLFVGFFTLILAPEFISL